MAYMLFLGLQHFGPMHFIVKRHNLYLINPFPIDVYMFYVNLCFDSLLFHVNMHVLFLSSLSLSLSFSTTLPSSLSLYSSLPVSPSLHVQGGELVLSRELSVLGV